MNYLNSQLLDELAAQYALGTLRGLARQRFERLCRQESLALQALHRWEDRLVGLMIEVKPIEPPRAVWEAIQRRLGHDRRESAGFMSKLFGWWNRSQLAMAASIAALALTVAVVTYLAVPRTEMIAAIADTQQTQQWRVEARKDRSELSITRSASTALEANRDYELWALSDSGGAPVSLGLLPKSGERGLQLNQAQRLALVGATKIAVSLEPLGGSPNGAPTTVLFVADLIRSG